MNGPDQPLDAFQLIASLAGHKVDFVVIGGVALQAHGHVRTTLDLDVIAGWTPENMRRLAAALRELDAKLRGIDADLLGLDLGDPDTLLNGGNFLMHTRHGDLDVFAVDQTPGAPARFEDLRGRAIAVEIRGVTLLIADPDDLIRMKTAASQFRDRPEPKRRQDLDDIAVLERLRAGSAPAQGEQAPESTRQPLPRPAPPVARKYEPPRREGREGPER